MPPRPRPTTTANTPYTKNYLSDVILRIDFSLILDLAENPPTSFQDRIRADYPILEPVKQFGVRIENLGADSRIEKDNRTTWRFKSRDGNKLIELDVTSLVINYKRYENYHNFHDELQRILGIFLELYPSAVCSRLGLRFVNQIHLEEADMFAWETYINPNLIKSLEFIEDKRQLVRNVELLELNLGNDTKLNFRYGIFNSVYPAQITRKEFFLDYDCYIQNQLESTDLESKINSFHDHITTYFEKSITEGFRAILRNE
jgi:uncharacterized protein (TIGR04255 family)